jgi:ABC-2 type transport system permease protein
MRAISNIFWLGTKEIRSFLRDWVLVGLTIWAFSIVVIAQAQSNSQELHNASIAYVDEDHSELSRRIIRAFLPPYFHTPQPIAERDIIPLMNAGRYTFIVDIPPDFEKYVLGGRAPAIQVNVDATAMVQAGLGSRYAQQIITTEIQDLLSRKEGAPLPPVNIDVRVMFNPNIDTAWFTSVMGIINNVTMGAAIVREREHGTLDHLLVMPLTPFEIAMSKVWANSLVITIAAGLSLYIVVRTLLRVPIVGSVPLFMLGVAVYLFFTCAIGIFLGTVARTMPQLGLLFMLIFLPIRQQRAAGKYAVLAAPSCRLRRRRISCRSRRRFFTAAPASTWSGRNLFLSLWSAPCSLRSPSCAFARPRRRPFDARQAGIATRDDQGGRGSHKASAITGASANAATAVARAFSKADRRGSGGAAGAPRNPRKPDLSARRAGCRVHRACRHSRTAVGNRISQGRRHLGGAAYRPYDRRLRQHAHYRARRGAPQGRSAARLGSRSPGR